jgi:hypothetical protein
MLPEFRFGTKSSPPMRQNRNATAVALVLSAFLAPAPAAEVKTSKERLSDKASDEQRVDDCRVPSERRGAVARPGCPDEARSGAASTGTGEQRAPTPR